MSVTVLQKALLPWQSADVLSNGSSNVGGVVTLAGEAARLTTAADVASAYGWESDRVGASLEHVDVVRFPVDPLMRLTTPRDVPDAPWPTYGTGFLRSPHLVRAWVLERTRYPLGAECWRIAADGRQELVGVYQGAARGWSGAQAYAPPVRFVGPRAVWRGVEHAADLVGDGQVELVAAGPAQPEGFTPARPMTWVRRVPVAECTQVSATVLEATWRSVRVRVLDTAGDGARVLLQEPSGGEVARLGAGEVEPGFFEAVAPRDELVDVAGTVRELPLP
ncbi:hypothetical protein ACFUMH_10330 [Cellulomonas sp. NPDC057328]|uniref:hypothetical protein n=1 Tax=Cellulomonas sp. NPDC057328 TaxID=3346101 RepID=UPI00362D9E51